MNDKKKRYQIYITEDVMRRLKHICLEEGINTSCMIENLIMIEINKEEERKITKKHIFAR